MASHSVPVATLLSVGALVACSGSRAREPSALRSPVSHPAEGVVQLPSESLPFIQVETVSSGGTPSVLRAPARVVFQEGAISNVGSPLPGRVVRVHVRSGDSVRTGDALVTLDCPEAAQSRATLAAARAGLREVRASLDRQVRMVGGGVGTERERLAAERALAEAEAEFTRAEAAVRFVGRGEGTTVVLRAQIAGTVIDRNASVGAPVDPGDANLVTVGDVSRVWVLADVFEWDLHLVHEGAEANIEMSFGSAVLSGRVVSIGRVVERGIRTAPVRILLRRAPAEVRPGMFGRASIAISAVGIAVPTSAVLLRDGKQAVVYVEGERGTFVRRPVSVTQPAGDRVLVGSGINPGERVVVRGAVLLEGSADQLL